MVWSCEKDGRGQASKKCVRVKSTWQKEERQTQKEIVCSARKREVDKHSREAM